MAARGIALGRIIDWAKNADLEEVDFVLNRMGTIMAERKQKVDNADSHAKVKRTRRARTAPAAQTHVVHTDESAHLDAPEKAANA